MFFPRGCVQVLLVAEKYSADRSIPLLIEGETGTGKETDRPLHPTISAVTNTLIPFVAIIAPPCPTNLWNPNCSDTNPRLYRGTRTGRIGKLNPHRRDHFF
jgi:DNA-binding NtrC family response regulator